MYLIQLLLPLYDNNGTPFEQAVFDGVRNELTAAFGGVTVFRRSPAEGLWADEHGRINRDEVVIFEVMAEPLDRAWWARYRQQLERRFRQDQVLIRASQVEQL